VVKLRKVKGEYSYDNWSDITPKKIKTAEEKEKSKKDPSAGIMDMMKDMYNDGDDNMKKIIGEAMLKSKQGGKDGGMGDMPDMGDM
jgi:calcyclin binding protein